MTRILLLLPVLAASVAAEPKSFSVEVKGAGKPMILIPGMSSRAETWDSTVARYRNRYQCHLLTLAGFAGKPAVEAPFLDTVRRELAAYIREQKLDRPVIVGHSLGGFLALWLAATEPDLTGKLVIVDALPFLAASTNPSATAETAKPMADKMRAGILKAEAPGASDAWIRTMATKAEDSEKLIRWSRESDKNAVADSLYEMWTTDLRGDIARIRVPVLVLGTWIAYREYATRDAVEANFRNQYAKLRTAEIHLFDTARHFIMWDDPEGFFSKLDAFLKDAAK